MKLHELRRAALAAALVPVLGVVAAAQAAPEWHHLDGGTVFDVFFLDNLKGWICEDGGRIRLTINGGADWNYAKILDDDFRGDLRGVFFRQVGLDLIGWACGDGGQVLKSTNGGVDGPRPTRPRS